MEQREESVLIDWSGCQIVESDAEDLGGSPS